MTRKPIVVLAAVVALTLSAGAAVAAGPAWLDRGLSARDRAAAVVAQMTLDEKITELHGVQDSQHQRYVPGIPRLNVPPLRITKSGSGMPALCRLWPRMSGVMRSGSSRPAATTPVS